MPGFPRGKPCSHTETLPHTHRAHPNTEHTCLCSCCSCSCRDLHAWCHTELQDSLCSLLRGDPAGFRGINLPAPQGFGAGSIEWRSLHSYLALLVCVRGLKNERRFLVSLHQPEEQNRAQRQGIPSHRLHSHVFLKFALSECCCHMVPTCTQCEQSLFHDNACCHLNAKQEFAVESHLILWYLHSWGFI